MVSFTTLLIGLVFGQIQVSLAVSADVAWVDLLLDGGRVARVEAPWTASLDLGRPPAPHELVAVAFDAGGRELARARQWVNRPRPAAEAAFALDRDSVGRYRFARLTWTCLTSGRPTSIAVTFDGRPLAVTDPSRIELPTHVPEQVHFLRAELKFDGDVSATAEVAFGGRRKDEALKELTAVPVVLERSASIPEAEGLAGWFLAGEAALPVVAVEEGGKEVVFVCDTAAQREMGRPQLTRGDSRDGSLAPDANVRFLPTEPRSTLHSGFLARVYPISRPLAGTRIRSAARSFFGRPASPSGPQRIADAVATAAIAAASGERRRAVVLVLGSSVGDESDLSTEEARAFLASLGVPLHVWQTGPTAAKTARSWKDDDRRLVRSQLDFASALAALDESLERQRVVWVEGAHLPQAIRLGPSARGIRLAR